MLSSTPPSIAERLGDPGGRRLGEAASQVGPRDGGRRDVRDDGGGLEGERIRRRGPAGQGQLVRSAAGGCGLLARGEVRQGIARPAHVVEAEEGALALLPQHGQTIVVALDGHRVDQRRRQQQVDPVGSGSAGGGVDVLLQQPGQLVVEVGVALEQRGGPPAGEHRRGPGHRLDVGQPHPEAAMRAKGKPYTRLAARMAPLSPPAEAPVSTSMLTAR